MDTTTESYVRTLEAAGYEVAAIQTGGGCMALRIPAPNGVEVLMAGWDGLPDDPSFCSVCAYDDQGECGDEIETDLFGIVEVVRDLLARVA